MLDIYLKKLYFEGVSGFNPFAEKKFLSGLFTHCKKKLKQVSDFARNVICRALHYSTTIRSSGPGSTCPTMAAS